MTTKKELIDEFQEYYKKAVNAVSHHFEDIKEYASQEIANYLQTKEADHIVYYVIDLREVEDLINFSEEYGKELEYAIIDYYGDDISASEPYISAIEQGLLEIPFVKKLQNSLDNN